MNLKNNNNNALSGIIPPMITPLKDIDQIDVEGLEKLVEHILSAKVSGLFILGTTGEFSSISYKLRYELIERVCKLVNGRIPVLVGITDTSIIESVRITEHARKCGASYVVAAPPFYYATGQPELIEYYEDLVQRLTLPLYLYNMPVHTKVVLEPKTVEILAQNSGIKGLKDSSANMVYFRSLQYALREKLDFELFVGPEEITADAVLLGASGGVNGGANMFPQLYVAMYNAAVEKDFIKIQKLQSIIMGISAGIYTVGRFGSSYLKGLKCALSVMGICDDFIANPFHKFHDKERSVIEKNLKELRFEF
jgi:4-hydroxy-tetrahydrodipicolinate synthase